VASSSEVEGWLYLLGAGMAGLRMLKEFGIRTSELDYFIRNFGKTDMRISAFAPPPLRDQYELAFSETEKKLTQGIEKIEKSDVTNEAIDDAVENLRKLYSLLGDAHRMIVSGKLIV